VTAETSPSSSVRSWTVIDQSCFFFTTTPCLCDRRVSQVSDGRQRHSRFAPCPAVLVELARPATKLSFRPVSFDQKNGTAFVAAPLEPALMFRLGPAPFAVFDADLSGWHQSPAMLSDARSSMRTVRRISVGFAKHELQVPAG
jgi:hypothetical protein